MTSEPSGNEGEATEDGRAPSAIATEDPDRRSAPTPALELGVERDRVFASVRERMFGEAEPVMLGRFVLSRKLGAGAMGVVFAAYDPQLHRTVALKLLDAEHSDDEAEARLEREARALARLRHPNVVAVHEVGNHRGKRFIAMDLVEGVTLRTWLQTHQHWRAVLDVLVQAGHGLAAAHAAGLVHRDFKPDNVLVEHGQARVVDFGLSRPGGAVPASEDGTGVNAATGVVGTPAYMAPEAFLGEASERVDQFAFCATLYEALFGVRPFEGRTIDALRGAAVDTEPQRPRAGRRAPAWLRRAVVRGLAVDPQARWPSMTALLQAIERRRRRPVALIVATAAIAGVVAGAVGVSASTTTARRCDAEWPALATAWNDARADAIAASFAATALPYATSAWARTRPIVERYAGEIAGMRHAACVATHERGEQSEAMLDARMQCLDRRLDELAALASAFEHADAEIVAKATVAATALGPSSACADLAALGSELARRGPILSPAPPELHARLARAKIGRRTGKWAESLADARELAARADAEGFVELAAAAHTTTAALEERAGELEAAERSAMAAIERAETAGDDSLRAEAQLVLVTVLVARTKLELAGQWVGLTRATLERLERPPRLLAALAIDAGLVAHAAGRYEEALGHRREALALREEFLDELDPELADTHASIAAALLEAGRPQEAREELALVLELRSQALGELHPDVARTHDQLGSVLLVQGDLDGAIEELQTAIDVATAALGEGDIVVGRVTGNLANALAQSHDPMSAAPYYRRSIEIIERVLGPDDVLVGIALGNFGRLLAYSPDPASAIDVLLRARGIETARLGPTHADLVYVENNLAIAYLGCGRLGEAAEAAERARSIATAALGPTHPLVGQVWLQLGRIARARADFGGAAQALERALAIVEGGEHRPAQRGEIRFELAQVLDLAGQRPRALALARAARADFIDDGVELEVHLEELDAWLATRSG